MRLSCADETIFKGWGMQHIASRRVIPNFRQIDRIVVVDVLEWSVSHYECFRLYKMGVRTWESQLENFQVKMCWKCSQGPTLSAWSGPRTWKCQGWLAPIVWGGWVQLYKCKVYIWGAMLLISLVPNIKENLLLSLKLLTLSLPFFLSLTRVCSKREA